MIKRIQEVIDKHLIFIYIHASFVLYDQQLDFRSILKETIKILHFATLIKMNFIVENQRLTLFTILLVQNSLLYYDILQFAVYIQFQLPCNN